MALDAAVTGPSSTVPVAGAAIRSINGCLAVTVAIYLLTGDVVGGNLIRDRTSTVLRPEIADPGRIVGHDDIDLAIDVVEDLVRRVTVDAAESIISGGFSTAGLVSCVRIKSDIGL